MEEKVSIQKALLYLESIHGRPNSKEDRDIVRPFYDRYRILKRMVVKQSMVSVHISQKIYYEKMCDLRPNLFFSRVHLAMS